MDSRNAEASEVLESLRQRGAEAVAESFGRHRDRLARMVFLRLDQRLKRRVDVEDVLQEAYLSAVARLGHYLANPSMSFFIWIRLIVDQTLIDVHRRHLGSKMRDAGREIGAAERPRYSAASSSSIAIQFVGRLTSPSQAAIKAEMTDLLAAALDRMNATDREILTLRHLEELSNREVAETLGIREKAASIRYVRAIARLKKLMHRFPGLFGESIAGTHGER